MRWSGNSHAAPLTRPGLDDPWPVTTHLPPGDGTGPPINFARVQYWSVRDVAAFRALINLAYRWHIEGKRLMPARRGNHWLQRRDPKQYDVITDAIAEELCFPPETGAKRRDQRIADARDTLDKLVKEGDAECRDGRLLPPPRRSDGAGTQNPERTAYRSSKWHLSTGSTVRARATPTSTEERGQGGCSASAPLALR